MCVCVCVCVSARSGYRIQVDPAGNATRAIYYMERELANMDPSRPKNYNRSQSHPLPPMQMNE